MQIGVGFPHYEIEIDPIAIRDFAQGVEALGFAHINATDHVINTNPASRPDWPGGYDITTTFFEPLTLFSYLAAATKRIGFASGVIVLPQRQAVLFAKQAACLDVLCGGRLRLGVAIGYDPVQYEALGVPFRERGRIIEDQIQVLRSLWTQQAVTVRTPYHAITDAGLNPLPLQRPIPIWMGGGGAGATPIPGALTAPDDRPLQRIARLADGWMPTFVPDDRGAEVVAKFRAYCREYGRDPANVGLESFVLVERGNDAWLDALKAWQKLGATHITVGPMDGHTKVAQHLRRLEEIRNALRPEYFP